LLYPKVPFLFYANEIPNVFCIFSRSRIARHVVVTIISLNSGTFAFFPLDMAPGWTGSEMKVLEQYGL
jgi:hypothetical protein